MFPFWSVYSFVRTCMYGYVWIWICMHACIHMYAHVCMDMWIWICMYVCMHIYVHTHTHTHTWQVRRRLGEWCWDPKKTGAKWSWPTPVIRALSSLMRIMDVLRYSILYYTVLYYTILFYFILYYTILYYTILYYTILYYTILYYTILYYTILYYAIPFARYHRL